MKFNAQIVHLTARAQDNDRVEWAGFDATDEWDAARKVADWDAKRRHGDDGMSSWLSHLDNGSFRSFVGTGECKAGGYVIDGVTIEIRLTPVK